MGSTKLKELIDYCSSNKRVCPVPSKWDELWKLLSRGKDRSSLPPPLILTAWYDTTDEDKSIRLIEHLQFSEKEGLLDKVGTFLYQLNETHWYHSGD